MPTKEEIDAVEVTPEEIAELLKRPSDFAYFGDNEEMFVTWAYGPVIEHRDTDTVTVSNARQIEKLFEELIRPEHYDITEASHWAVGWVKHLSMKVKREDGTPTRAVKLWKWISNSLEDYPVLDESDLSELEEDEKYESWNNWAAKEFADGLHKKFDHNIDYDDSAYTIIDGLIDILHEEDLRELFESKDPDWTPESSGGMAVNIGRVVEKVTAEDIVQAFRDALEAAKYRGKLEAEQAAKKAQEEAKNEAAEA